MRKSKQSQGRTPGQGNRSLFRRTVFLLGIIGIAQAKMGSGSSKAGLAKGGKITSIIGICISLAGWLLNIILTVALL